MVEDNNNKPVTYPSDLANLPPALAPLIERPQWAIWRWEQLPNGKWQKPPFMATQPGRNASVTDPSTWTDYKTALAAVQAGLGDGLTYVLVKDDDLGAIDIDNCRDIKTGSIAAWAQNFLDVFRLSYVEVTPSGTGIRVLGLASGNKLHTNIRLEIDGKTVGVELFCRTNKALTVTGAQQPNGARALTNIDAGLNWAITWTERRKAEAAKAAAPIGDGGFNSTGSKYSIDQIEEIVRSGAPDGTNRSELFHTVVGHYSGCGWDAEQIEQHLQQFPNGIGGRYLSEGRLREEIERSLGKYAASTLPVSDTGGWVNGWEAEAPQPDVAPDLELADDPDPDEQTDPDLDDEDIDDEPPKQDPDLPPLYAHGGADSRPTKRWLLKHVIPVSGHGLLSGQYATGKTFVALDLAAALGTGQPWLGHAVKRQCGVLLIALEGAYEIRERLDAVIRTKCGNIERLPFLWYETAPPLMQKGSAEKLIAMARQAEALLLKEFGLPLGLIIIDTLSACAGFARSGDENDAAAGQAMMNVLGAVARATGCFVLGVDHFGKNLEAGTRGSSSKESSADVVLACLGEKQLSGDVTNTRLAVRKCRGGKQGQVHPFTLRLVEAPELDEDGDPVTTRVVDWITAPPGSTAKPAPDPWTAEVREATSRDANDRFKRVLMSILADRGVDLPIPPDGQSSTRMIKQEIVREEFYAKTLVDGTPRQKKEARRKQFTRALQFAADRRLIGAEEIDGTAYLWLRSRPDPDDEEEKQ